VTRLVTTYKGSFGTAVLKLGWMQHFGMQDVYVLTNMYNRTGVLVIVWQSWLEKKNIGRQVVIIIVLSVRAFSGADDGSMAGHVMRFWILIPDRYGSCSRLVPLRTMAGTPRADKITSDFRFRAWGPSMDRSRAAVVQAPQRPAPTTLSCSDSTG
jgi:hypothetical protein